MANKQKRNSDKKWVVWVLVPVLFIVVGVMAFFICRSVIGDKKKDEAVPEQSNTKVEKKKQENKNTEEETEEKEEPKVKQYEGEDPNLRDDLSGVITYAGVNNDVLMIRVNIDQFVDGGICNLTLVQNGDAMFGASTVMIENASTATCDGFDIPIQGFESGQTTIVVDLEANGKSGQLVGEVEI